MSDTKATIWKSYEELAGTDEYKRWADDEFPVREGLLDLDRRDFVKLGGASLALAGLSGCRFLPQQKAVPYVRAPEGRPSGVHTYATALTRGGVGMGVLVEQHEGRPTKIEGNPNHPSSLGATDIWVQAEILNLYDPDRAKIVRRNNEPSSWEEFFSAWREQLKAMPDGDGVRLLTESVVSPALAAAIQSFLSAYPKALWHQWQPLGTDSVLAGSVLALGKAAQPLYSLRNARVIVSLDADFLLTMPGSVRYSREFADGRRVRGAGGEINRLYSIESSYTITGASSDHRLAVKPGDVENVARALYAKLMGASGAPKLAEGAETFVDALAKDLAASAGAALVIPGDEQSPAVHALAQAINLHLRAAPALVSYIAPLAARPESGVESIKSLTQAIGAGSVKALLIVGGNPVYNAPADLKLAELLLAEEAGKEKVPFRAYLGRWESETGELCHWQLPESHALEAWGDARGHDGTVSIVQPLIHPLYETRSALEFIAALAGKPAPGQDLVRSVYGSLSDTQWQQVLEAGVMPGTARAALAVQARPDLLSVLGAPPASSDIQVNFRPDPTLYDGEFANNAWLQELPKPITTIVWDNAAIISPATAKKIGLIPANGESDAVNIAQWSGRQKISLSVGGTTLAVPAWILPGQPNDCVTLYLGGGRTRCGSVGDHQGVDVYPLRRSDGLGHAPASEVKPTGEVYELVFTQPHHLMRSELSNPFTGNPVEPENREIIRSGRFDVFKSKAGKIFKEVEHHDFTDAGAHGAGHGAEEPPTDPKEEKTVVADWYRQEWKYIDGDPSRKSDANKSGYTSLYPEYSRGGYNQWGMSIDLSVCTGCNACTIACQAENTVPVVGKEQVAKGREMHWIRMDHYFEGPDLENVESHFLPVPCMQCEKAPCEPVCPVAATVHSHEGLNQMVYNRCIGTRYCSNNCPYKVRRFNFLKWTQADALQTRGLDYYRAGTPLKMMANPDVSIRARGVMEKCTYCVQRINEVRIDAKKEGREIQDGEILTACQQVCPTRAIVFGDLNNPESQVSLLKREPHDYALLELLNTRPRTTYLARIKNPNPALSPAPAETAGASEGH